MVLINFTNDFIAYFLCRKSNQSVAAACFTSYYCAASEKSPARSCKTETSVSFYAVAATTPLEPEPFPEFVAYSLVTIGLGPAVCRSTLTDGDLNNFLSRTY